MLGVATSAMAPNQHSKAHTLAPLSLSNGSHSCDFTFGTMKKNPQMAVRRGCAAAKGPGGGPGSDANKYAVLMQPGVSGCDFGCSKRGSAWTVQVTPKVFNTMMTNTPLLLVRPHRLCRCPKGGLLRPARAVVPQRLTADRWQEVRQIDKGFLEVQAGQGPMFFSLSVPR